MSHIKNFLRGIGSVLGVFGTAPSYRMPDSVSHYQDFSNLSMDIAKIGSALSSVAYKIPVSTSPSKKRRTRQ